MIKARFWYNENTQFNIEWGLESLLGQSVSNIEKAGGYTCTSAQLIIERRTAIHIEDNLHWNLPSEIRVLTPTHPNNLTWSNINIDTTSGAPWLSAEFTLKLNGYFIDEEDNSQIQEEFIITSEIFYNAPRLDNLKYDIIINPRRHKISWDKPQFLVDNNIDMIFIIRWNINNIQYSLEQTETEYVFGSEFSKFSFLVNVDIKNEQNLIYKNSSVFINQVPFPEIFDISPNVDLPIKALETIPINFYTTGIFEDENILLDVEISFDNKPFIEADWFLTTNDSGIININEFCNNFRIRMRFIDDDIGLIGSWFTTQQFPADIYLPGSDISYINVSLVNLISAISWGESITNATFGIATYVLERNIDGEGFIEIFRGTGRQFNDVLTFISWRNVRYRVYSIIGNSPSNFTYSNLFTNKGKEMDFLFRVGENCELCEAYGTSEQLLENNIVVTGEDNRKYYIPLMEEDAEPGLQFRTKINNKIYRLWEPRWADIDPSNFPYGGEFKIPPGRYLVQLWGASGSQSGSWPGFNIAYGSTSKGLGGYIEAILEIKVTTTLFLTFGGEPSGQFNTVGGFNGGGNGQFANSTNGLLYVGCGGGGASDLRVLVNDLYHRILVAGGAGGNGCREIGGHGGNEIGQKGHSCNNIGGQGGTQSGPGGPNGRPGSFGIGASALNHAQGGRKTGYVNSHGTMNTDEGGGGGGGWWGGNAGYAGNGRLDGNQALCGAFSAGGGGSSYALTQSSWKPNGYFLEWPNYILTNIVMRQGANNGPGRGMITRLL